MPRAKLRTPELRERLVEVAVDTLSRDGVEGFTTRNLARSADTSPAALYELFGDRGGLVREVFFEGFRRLGRYLNRVPETDDSVGDLRALGAEGRRFVVENPVLAQVMFSRPFSDFDPGPEERAAGDAVRELIVGRVRRCTEAGEIDGDPTDVAHVLLALTLGMASAEAASRLGSSAESIDRRWDLALRAMLAGLATH